MNSIFRYPGGKARHAPRICALIPDSRTCFIEPFCGGASVSAHLLSSRTSLSRLTLVDANKCVCDFWRCVFSPYQRAKLIKEVLLFVPSVADYASLKNRTDPFAFLAINRLSHSGRGGGPIGGWDQSGEWKINARWNAKKLADAISFLGTVGEKITSVENSCGIDALRNSADIAYVDPPYVDAGPSLYSRSFTEHDHMMLHEVLSSRDDWILSYDDHEHIKAMYSGHSRFCLDVLGAAPKGGGRKKTELVYVSRSLAT